MPYKKNTFSSALSFNKQVLLNYKDQIEIQDKLLTIIKSTLPERLSKHAMYCVLSKNKASLFTDAAVWSSQLRFYQQSMLKALIASNIGIIETLQIKIIPPTAEKKERETLTLPSSETIQFIVDQANNQTDEKLKQSLLKLGKTFAKLSAQS